MTSSPLQDRRILVVEDEYYLAMDLEHDLEAVGALVRGPVPSVEKALALISSEPGIDAALLDINLGGEMGYPVADALIARGIPFVFTTGYADGEFADLYPRVPNCEKPVDFRKLVAILVTVLGENSGGLTRS